jgi:hypothetical protein
MKPVRFHLKLFLLFFSSQSPAADYTELDWSVSRALGEYPTTARAAYFKEY